MATWPRHVILLVITSNDIPLSPPIALTHYFVPDGLPFWYTKPYSSIVGNPLSYIALLRSAPAAIPFVGKHSLCHPIAVSIPTYQYPVCWDLTFFIRIRWDLDYPTKSCNWQKLTKQNQPRMALALGRRDSSSKHRCQTIENLRDKPMMHGTLNAAKHGFLVSIWLHYERSW